MTDAVHKTLYARPCEKCGGAVLAQSELQDDLDLEIRGRVVLKFWLRCQKCGDVTPYEGALAPTAGAPN